MKKETLFVEFTGQQELEVYYRLQRAVDEWNKLEQQPQIEIASKLQSRKDIEKRIIIRALDSYLKELPEKQQFERRIRQQISDDAWKKVKQMDKEHRLNKLKQMCREEGLPIGNRGKKELAWQLLNLERGNSK